MTSGGPPYYGRWSVNDVYEAWLDNNWVYASPEGILLTTTPGPAATYTITGPSRPDLQTITFTFNASCTLNVGSGLGTPGSADVFVVSGGSPGSNGLGPNPLVLTERGQAGGNGGAGGLTRTTPNHTISINSPIPIIVGGGGSPSSFGPLVGNVPGTNGAAGSGGAEDIPGTAGGPGPTTNDYTGNTIQYSGGGGGGGGGSYAPFAPVSPGSGGAAGAGGGGAGGYGANVVGYPAPQGGPSGGGASNGANGTAGRGGGGGGGGGGAYGSFSGPTVYNFPGGSGGSGGSGVIIMRVPGAVFRVS